MRIDYIQQSVAHCSYQALKTGVDYYMHHEGDMRW